MYINCMCHAKLYKIWSKVSKTLKEMLMPSSITTIQPCTCMYSCMPEYRSTILNSSEQFL